MFFPKKNELVVFHQPTHLKKYEQQSQIEKYDFLNFHGENSKNIWNHQKKILFQKSLFISFIPFSNMTTMLASSFGLTQQNFQTFKSKRPQSVWI